MRVGECATAGSARTSGNGADNVSTLSNGGSTDGVSWSALEGGVARWCAGTESMELYKREQGLLATYSVTSGLWVSGSPAGIAAMQAGAA